MNVLPATEALLWDAYLIANRKGGVYPDLSGKFDSPPPSVSEADVLEWLDENPGLGSEPSQTRLLRLASAGAISLDPLRPPTPPSNTNYYILPIRDQGVPVNAWVEKRPDNEPEVLSFQSGCPGETPAEQLTFELAAVTEEIYDGALVPGSDNKEVRYAALRELAVWKRLIALLGMLPHTIPEQGKSWIDSLAAMNDEFKKSFFFNLYNLLVYLVKLEYGHPKSVLAKGKFYGDASLLALTDMFAVNLTDIEHMILRRKAVTQDRLQQREPNALLALTKLDPRMHFALNCGAQSCPAYSLFRPERCNEDISIATQEFLDQDIQVLDGKVLVVSRLLKWFRNDFTPGQATSRDALVAFLLENGSQRLREKLGRPVVISKIKFKKYNWADNGNFKSPPETGGMFIYDVSFARQK